MDIAHVVLQIGNACLAADDFRVKYEMELVMHQLVQIDINGFQKAIPLLGLYPKNPETLIQNLCTLMFIAAKFTIAKWWKQPKCPSVDEWIKKQWYIYTMEYYAAERKKELLPFPTAWMELESIMLSEISQVVKHKYHMISPISGT